MTRPKRPPTIEGRPVTMGKLRDYVIELYGACFALRDPGHVCQGPLTLEHVTRVHSVVDGRQDNERHTTALCLGLNGISIASHELREAMRAELRRRYPSCDL